MMPATTTRDGRPKADDAGTAEADEAPAGDEDILAGDAPAADGALSTSPDGEAGGTG
jgi:hypothetical protein